MRQKENNEFTWIEFFRSPELSKIDSVTLFGVKDLLESQANFVELDSINRVCSGITCELPKILSALVGNSILERKIDCVVCGEPILISNVGKNGVSCESCGESFNLHELSCRILNGVGYSTDSIDLRMQTFDDGAARAVAKSGYIYYLVCDVANKKHLINIDPEYYTHCKDKLWSKHLPKAVESAEKAYLPLVGRVGSPTIVFKSYEDSYNALKSLIRTVKAEAFDVNTSLEELSLDWLEKPFFVKRRFSAWDFNFPFNSTNPELE